MNVQSTYIWERAPGEEIELRIGGEYTPAGQLTEYDQAHEDSVTLDWVCESNTHLASYTFSPAELDAMITRLLDVARAQLAQKKRFAGFRNFLNLPKFDAKPDYG